MLDSLTVRRTTGGHTWEFERLGLKFEVESANYGYGYPGWYRSVTVRKPCPGEPCYAISRKYGSDDGCHSSHLVLDACWPMVHGPSVSTADGLRRRTLGDAKRLYRVIDRALKRANVD